MVDTILLGRPIAEDSFLRLERKSLLHHTLVVGQSGSGKSFFVTRLIEEILLRSCAKVILFDPNGDYRRFREPSVECWEKYKTQFADYSKIANSIGINDYDNQKKFCDTWKKIRSLTLIADENDVKECVENDIVFEQKLSIHWYDLNEEEKNTILSIHSLTPEIQQLLKIILDYHRKFEIDDLIEFIDSVYRGTFKVADERNQIMYGALAPDIVRNQEFLKLKLLLENLRSKYKAIWFSRKNDNASHMKNNISSMIDYLGLATHSLLRTKQESWRFLSLVLDSVEQKDILFAVDTALSTIWKQARKATFEPIILPNVQLLPRYPIFIVLDEAHNLVPREPQGELQERVANKILQIASEGRKYGLYLILASQRPSKLHLSVVPECENSAILRLQSPDEIAFAQDKLGTNIALSASLPRFQQGRALIHGQWSLNGDDMMIAPARTTLGGKGIGTEWLNDPFK